MNRTYLRVPIAILAVVIVALAVYRMKTPGSSATLALPDYGTVALFKFTDQDGHPFGSQNLIGKIWVADFFFTRCMGPCPLLTAHMAELQKKFKAKQDLMFVSFSVDPEFDQPPVLLKYAASYGADGASWKFLTGPKNDVVTLIRNSFKLAVAPGDPTQPGEINIMHSTYFALVDSTGRVRGFYNSTDQPAFDQLQRDIGKL